MEEEESARLYAVTWLRWLLRAAGLDRAFGRRPSV